MSEMKRVKNYKMQIPQREKTPNSRGNVTDKRKKDKVPGIGSRNCHYCLMGSPYSLLILNSNSINNVKEHYFRSIKTKPRRKFVQSKIMTGKTHKYLKMIIL